MRRALLFLLLALLFLPACSESDKPSKTAQDIAKPLIKETSSKKIYKATDDLDKIIRKGSLRILTVRHVDGFLPREGDSLYFEQELAADFARSLGLTPIRVYVDSFEELIPALIEGRGDLIAANMRITEQRKQLISFTVPVLFSREQIIARKDDPINRLTQLKGRNISVSPGTSYIETLEQIQTRRPYVSFSLLPATTSLDQSLDRLVTGELDLLVADSIEMDVIDNYRDDVRAAFNLTQKVPLAWGIRIENPELKQSLDRFLELEILKRGTQKRYTGDLPDLKKRKVLRLITRNNGATYFLWKGELMGFEYELYKRFAEANNMRLQVAVAPSHEAMLPMLLRGDGDIASALLTPNETRKAAGITFTRPYLYTTQLLVGRSDEKEVTELSQLKGRTLVLRESSDYWQTAQALVDSGIKLRLRAAPENMETEEIIDRVASGEFDLTIADNIILELEMSWRNDIKSLSTLREERRPIAAAVRPDDKELKDALDAFFKKEYKGLYYNISYKKYFESPRGISKRQTSRVAAETPGQISPYDELFKKHAETHGFDWRMILAQAYQESRFDPKRKYWAGARGLLQVMPRTARAHGFGDQDLSDPEVGIAAGVEYLSWVRDRFPSELSVKDRMWFALAAYNAGAGHVHDARTLARRKGWNPDVWFDNVEKAMLLLSKPEYHKKAKYGYVRGTEPVHYVRNIRDRYRVYVQALGQACTETFLAQDELDNCRQPARG
jgi:membrane-bound lytic murein transglycosylase F